MNIGFRTDSSYIIGTGHIHRCLNLAESFKKKRVNSFFISRNYPGNINNLIKKKFKLVELKCSNLKKKPFNSQIIKDAEQTIYNIQKFKIKLIFIDNYYINELWENIVGEHCKIVLISDFLERKTKCDYYINCNVFYESSKDYKRILKKNCKKLIGPKYAIIKNFNNKTVNKKNKNKISVYMGGVDTKNYTTKIISILKKNLFKKYKILIIIGQKNLKKNNIINQIKNYKNFEFSIGNKKDLFNYFKDSSLVISNGGTSMYEHMTLGLKAIIVAQTKIQKKICKNLSEANLINFFSAKSNLNSGNINKVLKKKINFKKSEELKKLYDGKGSKRIVKYLISNQLRKST